MTFANIIGSVVVPTAVGGLASGCITEARRHIALSPLGMSPFDSIQGDLYAFARVLARSLSRLDDVDCHRDPLRIGKFPGAARPHYNWRRSLRRSARHWHLRLVVQSLGQSQRQTQAQVQTLDKNVKFIELGKEREPFRALADLARRFGAKVI